MLYQHITPKPIQLPQNASCFNHHQQQRVRSRSINSQDSRKNFKKIRRSINSLDIEVCSPPPAELASSALVAFSPSSSPTTAVGSSDINVVSDMECFRSISLDSNCDTTVEEGPFLMVVEEEEITYIPETTVSSVSSLELFTSDQNSNQITSTSNEDGNHEALTLAEVCSLLPFEETIQQELYLSEDKNKSQQEIDVVLQVLGITNRDQIYGTGESLDVEAWERKVIHNKMLEAEELQCNYFMSPDKENRIGNRMFLTHNDETAPNKRTSFLVIRNSHSVTNNEIQLQQQQPKKRLSSVFTSLFHKKV
jgi:hypothetical protein